MGGLGDVVVKSSKSMFAIKYERTPFFLENSSLGGGTYFLAVQKNCKGYVFVCCFLRV